MNTSFGIRRSLSSSFDEALTRVPEALKAEGFGILTQIDVKETLKQKIGVEFRRYRILGACNPPFAHEALSIDVEAGLMLPCNVIVFEEDDGSTAVLAVDPTKSAAAFGNPKLSTLATTVRQKLESALGRLG